MCNNEPVNAFQVSTLYVTWEACSRSCKTPSHPFPSAAWWLLINQSPSIDAQDLSWHELGPVTIIVGRLCSFSSGLFAPFLWVRTIILTSHIKRRNHHSFPEDFFPHECSNGQNQFVYSVIHWYNTTSANQAPSRDGILQKSSCLPFVNNIHVSKSEDYFFNNSEWWIGSWWLTTICKHETKKGWLVASLVTAKEISYIHEVLGTLYCSFTIEIHRPVCLNLSPRTWRSIGKTGANRQIF